MAEIVWSTINFAFLCRLSKNEPPAFMHITKYIFIFPFTTHPNLNLFHVLSARVSALNRMTELWMAGVPQWWIHGCMQMFPGKCYENRNYWKILAKEIIFHKAFTFHSSSKNIVSRLYLKKNMQASIKEVLT